MSFVTKRHEKMKFYAFINEYKKNILIFFSLVQCFSYV